MNKKLIVSLLFLSFSTKMAFCALLEITGIQDKGQGKATISLKRRQSGELDGEPGAKRRRVDLSPLEQEEKNTRLWKAIKDENLNLDEVSGLLKAKADPNARNNEGETPLCYLASDPYGESSCNNTYNR